MVDIKPGDSVFVKEMADCWTHDRWEGIVVEKTILLGCTKPCYRIRPISENIRWIHMPSSDYKEAGVFVTSKDLVTPKT